MHKYIYSLAFLVLLISGACALQETPLQNTTAPTIEPANTDRPTDSPSPEVPSTETPLPIITLIDQFPSIISSSDPFNQVVSIDPDDPKRIAYCAPGEIRVSMDAGQTWESISTLGVTPAAQEHGYTLFYGEAGTEGACQSVTLDPQHSNAYYAVFTGADEEYGAPPVFYMGFFTVDSGETWQFVEPPENATLEDFGGFWNLSGGTVQAQFLPTGSRSQIPGQVLITETTNGGLAWQDGDLSCPSFGPCLRWGPAPSSIFGMGTSLPQSIFYSSDEGDTWSSIDPPLELHAPAPNQLVVHSESEIFIISGGITFSKEAPVLRRSLDAGASWQPVTLRPLSTGELNVNYFPGLQYLSNQTFLSQGREDSTWYWLQPDTPIWCPVNTDRLPLYPVLLQNAGDRVWWVNLESQQADNIPISELNCSVE
jgi:hypothetical protein